MIHPAISCNLDADILEAALPLLEASEVEALEWSFDTLYKSGGMPPWFEALLDAYGREGRLVGHGVYFSLFSGRWSEDQAKWLTELGRLSERFRFDHITEHFGFMTGDNFHAGAPISIPYNPVTLAIGQDRLKRIQQACRRPIGLENLAYAYSVEAVKVHGEFLEQLVGPVNGFIILDLHNLYCQLHNFEVDFEEMIGLYPLHRVREIHISGGSWEDAAVQPGRKIRRDTHDDSVPDEVFRLLEKTIPLCPNLKFVVLEQLGAGLKTETHKIAFRCDFRKMSAIVSQSNRADRFSGLDDFVVRAPLPDDPPLEDETLHRQQRELSHILENAADVATAENLLRHSGLAKTEWRIEDWDPAMLETAVRIAQKWRHGFV
ncbi:MAG TPA: DUF692 family protein [Flavilitoribacter sp.]|nr:DUF692 family protein [Flavilitoribacter sp.]HMQ86461.1 DUF692 family protein [Flavilitoribacter sp.]